MIQEIKINGCPVQGKVRVLRISKKIQNMLTVRNFPIVH